MSEYVNLKKAKIAHKKGKVVTHKDNEDLYLAFDSRTNVWTTYRYTYDDYCGMDRVDEEQDVWVIN